MESIEQNGSISQAAKDIGLSYKGALEILEIANSASSKALLRTTIGGAWGGGTRLTNGGKALLQLFKHLDEKYQSFLQQLNQDLSGDAFAQLLLEPLTIKNSAPNQLFGTIMNIQPSSVSVEVVVQLIGGERIVACLDFEEFDLLELNVGKPVLLLISSREISIMTDPDVWRFSTSNTLHSSVISIRQQATHYEVVLRLIGGDKIATVVSQMLAETIKLRPGMPTRAVFNGSAIIIATRV